MRPTVSVIMPVKDTPPDLLHRAVRSALEQVTRARVELVVWDDGSTDRATLLALGAIERVFRHLRTSTADVAVHTGERNEGISAARNHAVQRSSGDWLMWLDSDDELPPTAVDRLLAAAARRPASWRASASSSIPVAPRPSTATARSCARGSTIGYGA